MIEMDCGNPTGNITALKQQYLSGTAPGLTTYLESTFVKCIVGYKWWDGILTKNITCLATGRWSLLAACTCIESEF